LSGLLDTGLSLTSQFFDNQLHADAKTARVTQRDQLSMYATAVYGKNNAAANRDIAHRNSRRARGEINISEKMFAFAFTDFGYKSCSI